MTLARSTLVAAALAACVSGHDALGQRAWFIVEAPQLVTPINPKVSIDLYVEFEYEPGVAEAFAAASLDIRSTHPRFIAGYSPPGFSLSEPIVQPTRISSPTAQIHFPSRGLYANPANPVLVFTIEWQPTTFTPHWATFDITAIRMELYNDYYGEPTSLRVPNPPTAHLRIRVRPEPCYADCDTTTGLEVLDIFDFLCFGNRFAIGDPYACDCDTTTGPAVCDIFDLLCFSNAFAAGCD